MAGFQLHESIVKTLVGGWDLKVNSVSVLRQAQLVRADDESHTYEAVVWPGANVWVWVRARVKSGSPAVVFWFQVGYGSMEKPAPLFARETVVVRITGDRVGTVIETPSRQDPNILHGQGVAMASMVWLFDDDDDDDWFLPEPFKPTKYVPRDGTQSGGKEQYMGLTYPIAEHPIEYWREQLYVLGAYGGQFRFPNGRRVTEADIPDAVVTNMHFHVEAKDKGWIKYTVPNEPWRDRPAGRLVEFDRQHMAYDVVAQAYLAFPEDDGLAMLVIAAAERYLMLVPGRDKGTTHHFAGQHRSQGRGGLKSPVWLHKALMAMPDQDYLEGEIAKRVFERVDWQEAGWRYRQQKHGAPWARWGRSGLKAWNTGEVGIHFWGLKTMAEHLTSMGLAVDPRIGYMMAKCAEFCFTAFRDYDGKWGVPLYIQLDGKPSEGRSNSQHFCWLAATSYKQPSSEDDKMAGIKALDIEARFKE